MARSKKRKKYTGQKPSKPKPLPPRFDPVLGATESLSQRMPRTQKAVKALRKREAVYTQLVKYGWLKGPLSRKARDSPGPRPPALKQQALPDTVCVRRSKRKAVLLTIGKVNRSGGAPGPYRRRSHSKEKC